MERDEVGRRGVRANEGVAKDVLHRFRDVRVVADEREGEVRLVRHLLDRVERRGRSDVRADLVERDDGDALAEVALLEEVGSDVLVVDDDVVEASAGADFESGRRGKVGRVDVDEVGDEALDGGTVEPALRVGVVELERSEARLDRVLLLRQLERSASARQTRGDRTHLQKLPHRLPLDVLLISQHSLLLLVPPQLAQRRLKRLLLLLRRLQLADQSLALRRGLLRPRFLLLDLLLQMLDPRLRAFRLGPQTRGESFRSGELAHEARRGGFFGRRGDASEEGLEEVFGGIDRGGRGVVGGFEGGERFRGLGGGFDLGFTLG